MSVKLYPRLDSYSFMRMRLHMRISLPFPFTHTLAKVLKEQLNVGCNLNDLNFLLL